MTNLLQQTVGNHHSYFSMFTEIYLNWYGSWDSPQMCYRKAFFLICELIIAKWVPHSTHKYDEPKGLMIYELIVLWNAYFESELIMVGGLRIKWAFSPIMSSLCLSEMSPWDHM